MRRTQEGDTGRRSTCLRRGFRQRRLSQFGFYVNYQNDSLSFASSAEESVCSAASLGLSGPLTAPLLGQFEHDTSSRVRVEQDGRP